jgi:asparagine synthase (glutamine-hydrolysing)
MMHEPFYTSGTLVDERLGVWAGWTAFKGSYSDCMPAWNETEDICLIFSGEHFEDGTENVSLKACGHQPQRENAACLVHLYEEVGASFLERLNGWFSGLLLDFRENRIILFTDRYGMNRIYYYQDANGFHFASEAKALLKELPQTRQFDHRSLGEYFSCGCVLQNRTLFSGLALVPGGSAWAFSPGRPVRKEAYFSKETWEQQPRLNSSDYYEKLRATWTRVLPRYFRGQERVALSLTGGVDSRMILACAPSSPGTLPCFTFGGMYRDCADVLVSRQVAKLCRQPHETIALNGSFFSEFPALAERAVYITDGVLDASGSTDLYVHRRVRRIAPVRVTGLYGGELLRSLIVFKPTPRSREHLDNDFAASVGAAAETYAGEMKEHKQSFICFKQAPWHIYSRLAIERSQVTIRTPYFDNDLVALSYQAPPELMSYEPALRLIAESNPALKGIGTDRAVGVSSAAAVAWARHLLQEFTFRAEYAYDYGMPQWLAKLDNMFAPLHLEKLFLGRHKYYHFRLWYRDHFHEYLKAVLLDARTLNRPYLRGACLEKMIKKHISGQGNYTVEIQRILASELAQRQLIEQG